MAAVSASLARITATEHQLMDLADITLADWFGRSPERPHEVERIAVIDRLDVVFQRFSPDCKAFLKQDGSFRPGQRIAFQRV